MGTADLVTTLSGTGPFTVFAPTDDAFSAITVPTDATALANVLTYHVLSGQVLAADVTNATPATVQGGTITTSASNGAVTVLGAGNSGTASNVTEADIIGTNGVIHL